MAFIPVPEVVSCFLEHTGPDDVILGNVLNFRNYAAAPNLTNMAQLGSMIVSWYDTYMKPLKTLGYVFTRIRMRDLTDSNSYTLDYTTGLPITGTAVGNSLPSNVAVSVKLGTGFAGRSRRGRVYHFGMSEAAVTGNYLETAYAADVDDCYDALIVAGVASAQWEWVVVSKQQDGGPLVEGQATTISSATLVDTRIDTQRRRLPTS